MREKKANYKLKINTLFIQKDWEMTELQHQALEKQLRSIKKYNNTEENSS